MFSLGDKFSTSNVYDMRTMFAGAKLPNGFSLGDKFDISNVSFNLGMFENTELPHKFSLGSKLIEQLHDEEFKFRLDDMFYRATLPYDFFSRVLQLDKSGGNFLPNIVQSGKSSNFDKLQRAREKSDREYQEIDDFKDIKKPGE